jgi:protein-S-isoprenylcysteine O-methyltransferase Ste14
VRGGRSRPITCGASQTRYLAKRSSKNRAIMLTRTGTRMIAKLLLQNLIWIAGMGALLFVSAGTLHWPEAWVFLGTIATLGVAGGLWLAKTDPALLAERMRPMMQSDQPAADKKFMLVFGFSALVWFLAIGFDVREHGVRVPTALQVLGWAMLIFSSAFIMWVMRENSFAAPVVKLQTERGHRVVSTGPYAWVRHPMYSGTVLFFVGAPLLLGSWWGVAMSPLFILLFAIRTRIEERALSAGLPGYADYAARVRYRLVPGLW